MKEPAQPEKISEDDSSYTKVSLLGRYEAPILINLSAKNNTFGGGNPTAIDTSNSGS